MGLSASQARLLSITSRLSDNELRSQTITTAKMSLANRTTEASAEYMDALSQSQLFYTTYDTTGNKTLEKLTGTSLSYYGELKNQYGLINNNNQILVSEVDAVNYENSANLEEFLDKYGVLSPVGSGSFVQVVNPDWEVAWEEYEKGWEKWKKLEPNREDEKYWETRESVESSGLYEEFLATTAGCFSNAIGGSACYMHVLVDLVGPGTHTTSSGETFETFTSGWGWNNSLHPVNQELRDKVKEANCSGDIIEGGSEQVETSYGKVTVGGPPSDKDMSVYQRAVDLIWEGKQNYPSPSALDIQKFFYFVEHDLKGVSKKYERVFNEELYEGDVKKWKEGEPGKPDVPYYIDKEIRKIENKDKGQWYVNLWHRMNGQSDIKAGTEAEDGTIVGGGKTESGLPSYKVLEDGLMNSSEWLQYALEKGTITLERVDFTDPTEEGTGLADCTWTSIIWTNAQDITEEENEQAITKAEVQYEQTLRDIEAKDKRYDNQLKLLDTEHNALQTEYDSVKGVIEKNIERTLKIYS